MSYRVDVVRQYRTPQGKLSDDSTISEFRCDDTQCTSKRLADHDETILPSGWKAFKDQATGVTLHACSKTECQLSVRAWAQAGNSGRSTD